ncbi:uncharacterized protein E0L32_000234 [Thyridium curvatum]|uniref:Nephrocystin 3-like N-terminal domain-containing protein n=1 Tax=Thyridium curvatum TaxID=1093900 RepID=A0A507BH74_9PEZI|nr:uncharacterized protein E0L32_000234 [Thyridium curvatum]TPX15900.1 hypothetical protein E0L32_000234 [Thyridium curvatum]
MAQQGSLTARLAKLSAVAQDAHALLTSLYKRPRPVSLDVDRLSSLLRALAGNLVNLYMLASSVEDNGCGSSIGSHNLHHLQACERTLVSLRLLLKGESSSPSGRESLLNLLDELAGHVTNLRMASASLSLASLCKALSCSNPDAPSKPRAFVDRIAWESARRRPGLRDVPCAHPYNTVTSLTKKQCPGTNEWFTTLKQYQDWVEGQSAPLWFCGDPGSGKTMLASTIIEGLVSGASQSTAVCFHVADAISTEKPSLASVMGSLLCQLVCQNSQAERKLDQYLHSKLDELPTALDLPVDCLGDPPDIEGAQLRSALFRAISKHFFKKVFVVIDGIDELDVSVTETISSTNSWIEPGSDIRLLVLSGWPKTEDRASGFLYTDIGPPEVDLRFLSEWAIQQLEPGELLRHVTQAYVLDQKLQNFPSTVSETYATILARADRSSLIADNYPTCQLTPVLLLRFSLLWLLHLSEIESRAGDIPCHFSIESLCEALSLLCSPDGVDLSDIRMIDPKELISLLGCMVDYDSETVTLSHSTVLDFLSNKVWDKYGDIAKDGLREASTSLGTIMLRYLNLKNFNRPSSEFEIQKQYILNRRQRHPFYALAAAWWPTVVQEISDDALWELAAVLFDNPRSNHFIHWLQELCSQLFPSRFGFDVSPEPFLRIRNLLLKGEDLSVHIAAALGVPQLCSRLIKMGRSLNKVAGDTLIDGPPIYYAIMGPKIFTMSRTSSGVSLLPAEEHEFWGPARVRTIEMLMAHGPAMNPFKSERGDSVSLTASALLTSFATWDAEIFIKTANGLPPDQDCLEVLRMLKRDEWTMVQIMPRHRTFLNRVCEYIIDSISHMFVNPTSDRHEKCDWLPSRFTQEETLGFTFEIAEELGLDCVDPNCRRSLPHDDKLYYSYVDQFMRDFEPALLQWLMQDPRWDPNKQLDSEGDSESSGQTALHIAVEDRATDIIKRLFQRGSRPDVRDAQGRTPLMLVETPEHLRLLLDHGADVTATDDSGRCIWHFAAANNDADLLNALIASGDDKEVALRRVTKQGRTPLAEAFMYVRELLSIVARSHENPDAAQLLLPLCDGDEAYFKSDVPVTHLAAEWASLSLLTRLMRTKGVDFSSTTEDGSTPMHYLNFGATLEFVQKLREACGDNADAQRKDGKTPAETIFLSFKDSDPDPDMRIRHPAYSKEIDPTVYNALLTAEVLASRDAESRTLWERFCKDVVVDYISKGPRLSMAVVQGPIATAVLSLVDKGALAEYETQHKSSGFTVLVRDTWDKDGSQSSGPSAFSIEFPPIPYIMGRLYTHVLKATQYMGDIAKDKSTLLIFCWAARHGFMNLIDLMVEKGVSPVEEVKGMCALEEAVLSPVGNADALTLILTAIDKSQLNAKSSRGTTPLLQLCTTTHTGRPRVALREERMTLLLRAGADPHMRTADGVPAVVLAITEEQFECARLLIEAGADIRAKTPLGMDSALAAAYRGNMRLLEMLEQLSRSGDADKQVDFAARCSRPYVEDGKHTKQMLAGCNALHVAALYQQTHVASFYLDRGYLGVNDTQSDRGLTALHLAAMCGDVNGIRRLAGRGADIEARDVEGCRPLHHAVHRAHTATLRALLELGCERSPRDNCGVTPLILAIQLYVQPAIALLTETDADMTVAADIDGEKDVSRMITLPAPASERQARAVSRRHSSDTKQPQRGWSRKGLQAMAEAMEMALSNQNVDMCRSVLNSGCPVDILLPPCRNCTPLMLAMRMGAVHLVQVLLERGAELRAGHCAWHYPAGYNPVGGACRAERLLPCLRPVLDRALSRGHNWLGSPVTPLHVVAGTGGLEAMQVLLEHITEHVDKYRAWLPADLEVPMPPEEAGSRGVHAVVRVIVNLRSGVAFRKSSYDDAGSTPLRIAAGYGATPAMVNLLLDYGADPNIPDFCLDYPLHNAISNGLAGTVKVLLERGAFPDARDNNAYTPLMLACCDPFTQQDRANYPPWRSDAVATVRILIEHGADPRVRDVDGSSLLNLAAKQGRNPAVFDYLVRTTGLDPFLRDKTCYAPLHDAVLNRAYTSYVLSGAYDLRRLAAEEDLPKGLFAIAADDNDHILPRLLRRWPREFLGGYVGRVQGRYVSALCNAAARGHERAAAALLDWGGADMELEGAPEGTALMTACVYGRLGVARMLVRRGAAVSYRRRRRRHAHPGSEGLGGDGQGEWETRSALAVATPKIRRWILVGQFTERPRRVGYRARDGGATPDAAVTEEEGFKPWSGVREVAVLFTGSGQFYGRTAGESLLGFVKRCARIRREFRGQVVVPYDHEGEGEGRTASS